MSPRSRSAPAPVRPRPWPAWLAPAAIVAALAGLVAWVFRPIPGAFFALDDLVMFQQARGIRPWPLSPWRWLSGLAWFHAVTPLWGESPRPYHVASLVLHAVNAVLLWRLARRWGASASAAFVAAGLFAATRLHFSALFAATSVGELLALTFTFAALLLLAPGRRAVLAALAFALALSAKESVLLVPATLLALPAAGADLRARARAAAPLLATGLALGGALLAWGMFSGRLAGQAYAVNLGAALPQSLARLLGWSLDLSRPIPDLHAGASPLETALGLAAAAALAVLAVRWRSAPLVRAGLLWWLLSALPVLPLASHLYLHYLYTPLAGLALAASGAFDALVAATGRARAPGRAASAAWPAALAIVAAHGALSAALVTQRVQQLMPGADWPLDPVLRKSVIARRAIDGVASDLAGRRARVAIVLPEGTGTTVDLGTGRTVAGRTSSRHEIEEVLDGGRSLRAFVPNVDSVEFVRRFVAGHEDFDVFAGRADGGLVDLGHPPRAHALMAINMASVGLYAPALDWVGHALAAWPGDAMLIYARALVDERKGDHAAAMASLAELVRIAPGDSLAAVARQVLAREPRATR